MPYLSTADEWLRLSAQLLEARPTTTRVSTRYSISAARLRATSKAKKASASQDADVAMPDAQPASTSTTTTTTTTTTTASSAKPPRAKLILKTFDPHSGVCLKYKTAKAQEVGRLVQMLGSLGRNMAALPAALPAALDDDMGAVGTATPPVAGGAQQGAAAGGAPASGGDGGKGKKKKKGKR